MIVDRFVFNCITNVFEICKEGGETINNICEIKLYELVQSSFIQKT